jgi:hypothetical protein
MRIFISVHVRACVLACEQRTFVQSFKYEAIVLVQYDLIQYSELPNKQTCMHNSIPLQ